MPLANVSPSGAPNNACGGPRAPAPSMRGRRNPCQATEPYQPEPGNKQTCKGLHTTFSLHKKQTLNKQTNKTNETNKTNKQRCHQMIWIGHWSLILNIQDSPRQCKKRAAITPALLYVINPVLPLPSALSLGTARRREATPRMAASWLLYLALSATATDAARDWFLCGPQYQIRPSPTADAPDWIVHHSGCSKWVLHQYCCCVFAMRGVPCAVRALLLGANTRVLQFDVSTRTVQVQFRISSTLSSARSERV